MAKAPKLTREQIRQGLDTIPMDTLVLGNAAARIGAHLTPKQREFARLVALGEGKAQSYRKAYNSKGKPKTVATKGWAMTQREDIGKMIEAFSQAQRFAESHTPAQLRAFVVQQLTMHAANEENKPSERLKALQLLGTVSEVAAFTERKEVVNVKASTDLRERLVERLKLIGASVTQESNAAQDDAQDADSLLAELAEDPDIVEGELVEQEPDATLAESPQDDPAGAPPRTNAPVECEQASHSIPLT